MVLSYAAGRHPTALRGTIHSSTVHTAKDVGCKYKSLITLLANCHNAQLHSSDS